MAWGKKGIWREVLLPMIIGLIVLGILLYFIFNEYFSEDEINFEVCRQSVVLRGALPDVEIADMTLADIKNKFPLKCETAVIKIDFEDKTEAEELIGKTIAECWYTFLKGEEPIFSKSSSSYISYCVPCARIHFEPEVKDFYKGENEINMKRVLLTESPIKGATVQNYLGSSLVGFVQGTDAILWGTSQKDMAFELGGDKFFVDDSDTTGINSFLNFWGVFGGQGLAKVTLPVKLDVGQGDLMIWFQQVLQDNGARDDGIFWFQVNQKKNNQGEDAFDQLSKDYVETNENNAMFCDNFEGILA